MLIINQDHNRVIQKTQPTITAPIFQFGYLWAYGVYHGETLLGSFDTTEEALAEAAKVESCTEAVYTVTGYDDPDEDGDEDIVNEVLAAIGDTLPELITEIEEVLGNDRD